MKLLLVHNYYQQRGGEDVVFEAEAALLEEHGHHVLQYVARNEALVEASAWTVGRQAVWNGTTYADLRRLLQRERPAVVHVHNTLPVISPAVFYAVRSAGVPVVQTLHNYRLLCPSATLFRDGKVCEDCLHRSIAVPAVRHGCYRGSRSASGVVAAMLALHHLAGTWKHNVDLFIALTEFARAKFVEGGLPGERIVVKPNFAPDAGLARTGGDYALFVGRLSGEKGVKPLLEAWRRLGDRIRLRVIGDGPEAPLVSAAVRAGLAVDFLGWQTPDVVATAMAGARFLVFPSTWYEPFGLGIIEAYAAGLPVLASDIGGLSELVKHRNTGLQVRAGDVDHLVQQVEWALSHPDAMRTMGVNARGEYEARYTPGRNYHLLIAAYQRALRQRSHAGSLSYDSVSGGAFPVGAPRGQAVASSDGQPPVGS
ncbi:MAG: glycosyltransferase [Gemmatimonadales bacterium]|nr:glycosyltransferase [Gemmatimonadales bacterium]